MSNATVPLCVFVSYVAVRISESFHILLEKVVSSCFVDLTIFFVSVHISLCAIGIAILLPILPPQCPLCDSYISFPSRLQ